MSVCLWVQRALPSVTSRPDFTGVGRYSQVLAWIAQVDIASFVFFDVITKQQGVVWWHAQAKAKKRARRGTGGTIAAGNTAAGEDAARRSKIRFRKEKLTQKTRKTYKQNAFGERRSPVCADLEERRWPAYVNWGNGGDPFVPGRVSVSVEIRI